MKTFEYPLAAITFKKAEWDHILSPALNAALPRCGFVRTFDREMIHGSLFTGGMGLKHPFILQYIHQLSALLHQMRHATMLTPQLMISTLEQVRLEIGIGGELSDSPMEAAFAYMTDSWWKDLLYYLEQNDIQLNTTHAALSLSIPKTINT